MECGEIDFAHILAKYQGIPLSLNFIRVYWEQMLSAVQAIHDEKIVHSDLKPANFLLVQGQLKLIDFGIAKRMGDDTTNIHRDQQVCPPRTGRANNRSVLSIICLRRLFSIRIRIIHISPPEQVD